jgi:drug/metabolite transporter (DMT)-like permease
MSSTLIIPLLLIADSLHYVFARLLLPHISPAVSPMYVLLIGTVEVGIYGLATKKIRLSEFRKHAKVFLTIGFLVALGASLNYQAVAFVDPGTAAMLAQSGKLWSLALGILWLREILPFGQFLGAALAIFGVFIMNFQAGDLIQLGSLLIVISTFAYSLHAAISKRYLDKIDMLNFFFFRIFSTTLFLFVFSIGRQSLAWPSKTAWPILLLVGTIDIVVSRTLYYIALQRLKLSIHTIILTLSPVVTILWSLVLFKTAPTGKQLWGGLIVIIGILVIGLRRREEEKLIPQGD